MCIAEFLEVIVALFATLRKVAISAMTACVGRPPLAMCQAQAGVALVDCSMVFGGRTSAPPLRDTAKLAAAEDGGQEMMAARTAILRGAYVAHTALI